MAHTQFYSPPYFEPTRHDRTREKFHRNLCDAIILSKCVCVDVETRNETIEQTRNGTLQWRVTDIKPFYIPLTYLWSLGIDCNSNWTITKHMHVFSNDILSWTEPNTHRVFISLSNCSPFGFVSNEKEEKNDFSTRNPVIDRLQYARERVISNEIISDCISHLLLPFILQLNGCEFTCQTLSPLPLVPMRRKWTQSDEEKFPTQSPNIRNRFSEMKFKKLTANELVVMLGPSDYFEYRI